MEDRAGRVDVLAIADWGMNNDAQRRVAATMSGYVRDAGWRQGLRAVITGGDNIYLKLSGVDDPQWQSVFETMYDPVVLNVPFYTSPGNHDYEHGKIPIELAYARQNPESRFKMPATYYRLDLPSTKHPLVSFYMLDTNRDLMGAQAWQEQLAWLKRDLSALPPGDRRWRIAVGHHPLFTNGSHGDVGPLQLELGPLLKEHGVSAFVCGHDHDLQHLEIDGWPISFVLVGGGGAKVRPMRVDTRGPFSKQSFGFGHLSFTEDIMTVRLIDDQGVTLHSFDRERGTGVVRILSTSPSDKAVPRTPKSITRPDTEGTTRPASQPSTK